MMAKKNRDNEVSSTPSSDSSRADDRAPAPCPSTNDDTPPSPIAPAEVPEPSRHTFDRHWLTAALVPSDDPRPFEHHVLGEIPDSRALIQPYLGQAIVDHHFHRNRIADRLRTLGHQGAADYFSAELPKSNTTRKGNFGEVIASEHLMQRYGYQMPVFKLRFRDSHNLPMRGEDIVAFVVDAAGTIIQVVIGESKAIVKFRKDTVQKAHARLHTAFHPRPMTLSMLAEILYEAGRDELGRQIDRVSDQLARHDFPREHWLFLINEAQPNDAFDILNDGRPVVPTLHCVRLALNNMTALVNELFDNPPLLLTDSSDGA